jgi:hypothetical protein
MKPTLSKPALRISTSRKKTMMNTSSNQESAKIYQFPAGGRSTLGGRRYGESKAVSDVAPSRVGEVSGSWYHQAAIDESKPAWER